MFKRCRSSFVCPCKERMYYGSSKGGVIFVLSNDRAIPQRTSPRSADIESFTICSLLQLIVLRDILHVVRHGALHIFRALLSIAGAVLIVVTVEVS